MAAAPIAIALALCALYGLVVEVLAVRPFVRRGSDAWLMATVALGIVLDNVVLFTFGKEPRSLPSALATRHVEIGGIGLRRLSLQLLIPVVGVALAVALHVVARRTRWGIAMLAVVQNRDAARLMGIPIGRVVAAAFALSTMFAGIAGVLIAPLFNIHSDMGTLFGLKAFAVAILGGITNAWGVMLAGLIFGVVEALVTATLGSGLHADHHVRARDRGAGAAPGRALRPRARPARSDAAWRPLRIEHARGGPRHSGSARGARRDVRARSPHACSPPRRSTATTSSCSPTSRCSSSSASASTS